MSKKEKDIYTLAKFGRLESFRKSFNELNVNEKDKNGSALLHYAISGRNFDIASFLVKAGADVNISNIDFQTPLHLISTYQNFDLAEELLVKGADLSLKDIHGNIPLWGAVFNCKGKNYDILKLFIDKGSDIYSKNNVGTSPFDFANKIGDKKILSLMGREK